MSLAETVADLRDVYDALKVLVPAARQLIVAVEALEKAISLAHATDGLEEKKGTLTQEVADLILKASLAKQDHAAEIAQHQAAVASAQASLGDLRDQQAREAKMRAAEMAKAAEEFEAKKAAREKGLQDVVAAVKKEIAALTAHRDAVKEQLATALGRVDK